jgi:hypothetical protein
MRFEQAVYDLKRWFDEHGLSTQSLTLILNFGDRREALEFDAAFSNDTQGPPWIGSRSSLDPREIYGVEIRVESPLHAEPK